LSRDQAYGSRARRPSNSTRPAPRHGRTHEKFDAEGRLTDEKPREFLGQFLVGFGRWIRRLEG